MTSEKNVLKESMRLQLEQNHKRFISDTLGEKHPLAALQQVKVTRSIIDQELQQNKVLVADLAKILTGKRSEIRKQTAVLRELGHAGVDEVMDSLTELKDAVEDIKETVASTASILCPSDSE